MDRSYPLLALDIVGLASKKRIAAWGAKRFTARIPPGGLQ
jgi:hypothetical protein